MTGPAVAGGATTAVGSATGPAALTVDAVTWRIGAVPIVDDVSLHVSPNEFVALIGPNGAGKTSLFNLISGLRRPSAGRLRLAGTDVPKLAPHRRARLGLGRTFQTSAVFGSLSVADNVALAVQARRGGSMRAWRRRTDRTIVTGAAEILEQVRLDGRAGAAAGALAHGEKRKLEIALLLAG